MDNVYYSPEKHGLTVVAELELGECYEFDTFVVWKDAAGRFYWAHDTGCSCPTPFEGFAGVDDLYSLNSAYEYDKFIKDVESHYTFRDGNNRGLLNEFVSKVRRELWALPVIVA